MGSFPENQIEETSCLKDPKGLFTWRWGTPDRLGNMRPVTPPIM